MELFRREKYLSKIRPFYHENDLIKVITGVRRCGKSCLMHTVAKELEENGISAQNIVFIDLDRKEYINILKPDQLEAIIDEKTAGIDGTIYLFIDEIQNVKGFEPLINAYREEGNFSIFITGSNSYLLSGELITKLTGRYLEFEMFPLDFSEYLGMSRLFEKHLPKDRGDCFREYILNGGFPKAVEYDTVEKKRKYTIDVINEIIVKDIRKRVKIRNIEAFESVMHYIINNFGATTSITALTENICKAQKVKIKRETIERYVKIMCDAKVLYKCRRFDMKSKKSLGGEEKYYISDLAFYWSRNTDNRINYGPVLENIVFFDRLSKGFSVSTGRIGKLECDFITRNNVDLDAQYTYIQVAMTIAERETEDREYRPLEKIADNYPKYVLTLDRLLQKRNGIINKNLIDFISE